MLKVDGSVNVRIGGLVVEIRVMEDRWGGLEVEVVGRRSSSFKLLQESDGDASSSESECEGIFEHHEEEDKEEWEANDGGGDDIRREMVIGDTLPIGQKLVGIIRNTNEWKAADGEESDHVSEISMGDKDGCKKLDKVGTQAVSVQYGLHNTRIKDPLGLSIEVAAEPRSNSNLKGPGESIEIWLVNGPNEEVSVVKETVLAPIHNDPTIKNTMDDERRNILVSTPIDFGGSGHERLRISRDKKDAASLWDIGKRIGASFHGDDAVMIEALNDLEARDEVVAGLNDRRDAIGIQETKLEVFDADLAGRIWGDSDFDWDFIPFVGRGGGIACIWKKSNFAKSNVVRGAHFLVIQGVWIDSQVMKDFLGDGLWAFLGDFNAVRDFSKRRGFRSHSVQRNRWWRAFVAKEKLKLLKGSLKEWSRNVFGNLDVRIALAIEGIERLDKLSEEEILNEEEWKWRLLNDRNALWVKVVEEKYGLFDLGRADNYFAHGSKWWCDLGRISHVPVLAVGWCYAGIKKQVGDGRSTKFWTDPWFGILSLNVVFPRLFSVTANKEEAVADVLTLSHQGWTWIFHWRRNLFLWEEELLNSLLHQLPQLALHEEESDSWVWEKERNGKYTVSSAYGEMTASLSLVGFDANN
ncbi:hypothetical protein RIF29_26441 [Crotalaria pallida]|uniref:Uncharacterized protein n=1 Tax=Crotalaria pallida TaxID=3830 RepID=A0AAN9EQ50_CROPI